ncbi:MAG: glycerophosphodiester phosphodiesterase [Rhodocyclaceae bacterium]|jgi:glycerophosphoryl diester phosphodiesterase|nr:glycerophosphodiester phosphodiesterase [Rhodocyclaceae bacterium]
MASWPRVWAHRCGGALAPENTLAGLRAAVALGCPGVEFDVMLSRDGVPVLIHDETLERTTNGRGEVARIPAAELARLDAGRWFNPRFAGEPVPSLMEAIAVCRVAGVFMNVEIKPGAGREWVTGQVVARLLQRAGVGPDGLVLSSFSPIALAAAREAAPGLPRGLLLGGVSVDGLQACQTLGCQALHCDTRLLQEDQVREIKAAGLRVAVYTENEPAVTLARLAWGVDAVITDQPARLLADPRIALRQK